MALELSCAILTGLSICVMLKCSVKQTSGLTGGKSLLLDMEGDSYSKMYIRDVIIILA